jgi:hypothetical protein
LPKEVFDAIDAGSLELVQSDVVDQSLSERFSDALFRASLVVTIAARGWRAQVGFECAHSSCGF